MRRGLIFQIAFLATLTVSGCAGNVAALTVKPTRAQIAHMPASPTPSPTTLPPSPTNAATREIIATYTPAPLTLPTSTPSPTPLSQPSPTPDIYAGLRIEDLIARQYGGGLVEIEETLERNPTFNRYLIKYPSDGLTIYGFLNVPQEGAEFPVAIVLHGFIPIDEYKVQDYTTRYADWLAEEGYMVFHPNYRNHPPSDGGDDRFRIGYAVDVLNLLAIIRQQSQDPLGTLRRADAEHIHLLGHSMGGGIAWRTLVTRPEWVKAVALYGAMNADEKFNYEKIGEWTKGRAGGFERATPPDVLASISPINFLQRSVYVPVSIHHGLDDGIVPAVWSETACQTLEEMQYQVECYNYRGQPHTFYGASEDLFIERVISFFRAN